jgi:hypothetical protein
MDVRWTDEEIPVLLRRLSTAMIDETDAVAGLDHPSLLTADRPR